MPESLKEMKKHSVVQDEVNMNSFLNELTNEEMKRDYCAWVSFYRRIHPVSDGTVNIKALTSSAMVAGYTRVGWN